MSVESALRIKKIREFRNFTQQYMADQLDISQNAYSKIENGTTKITIDRLEKIAQLLDVPLENVISHEKQVFNVENHAKFYAHIENLHEENKEILLQQIEFQKQQLIFLQQQNETLIKTVELLSKETHHNLK
ncbi:MAG: helix-turn-helix transcriptional regulator [Sphingobacteriales bacterium]|nr:MAG: helix-turn-helix transcriptional regulator [Sphingobacteriales bacterium]